jgi:hypothetical protein
VSHGEGATRILSSVWFAVWAWSSRARTDVPTTGMAELDADRTTSSELLQAHLPRARVMKALNILHARDLASRGRPTGTPNRVAIPIAGDDAEVKQILAELIEQSGFDVADEGASAEGGRRLRAWWASSRAAPACGDSFADLPLRCSARGPRG